jgi:hypothetical protein
MKWIWILLGINVAVVAVMVWFFFFISKPLEIPKRKRRTPPGTGGDEK